MSEPRVSLVVGASSGIGRATAHQLAANGDHVVLAARGTAALEAAAAECDRLGAASTMVVTVDVRETEAVQRLVDAVVERHGRLDAVVESVGVVAYGRLEDVPGDVFDAVVRTNVVGAVNVARAALPQLRGQGTGSLVFIGSLLGDIAAPLMSSYVISKWAVHGLVRELQLENRDLSDVHICKVSPGGVDTPIYLQAANYSGRIGRPPPPVVSPEKVARAVMRVLEHPRPRVDVPLTNKVVRFGFSFLPRVFDVLVGPLFSVAAQDLAEAPRSEGNVFDPQTELSRLHGDQGNSVLATGKAVAAKLSALVGRS